MLSGSFYVLPRMMVLISLIVGVKKQGHAGAKVTKVTQTSLMANLDATCGMESMCFLEWLTLLSQMHRSDSSKDPF